MGNVKYNEYQQRAIDFKDGNLLINASAGSGKSSTILARTEKLVEEGVKPNNILLLTFSKKAVEDLKSKLSTKLKTVNVQTFHGLCYQLLLRHGFNKSLVKEWEVQSFFEKLITDNNLDLLQVPTNLIKGWIGYQKAYDLRPDSKTFKTVSYELPVSVNVLKSFYKQYQKFLENKNLIDFDDMLIEFLDLVKRDDGIALQLKKNYKYVMVDEHQDTNEIQNKIISLLAKTGNLVAVGDVKQCLLPETIIKTKDGDKMIRDIVVGDLILSASGRGCVNYGTVEDVMVSEANKEIVVLTTESGKVIKGTKEHTMFVNQTIQNKYFIYLMYREGMGYRIGVSSNLKFKNKGKRVTENGYYKRMLDEKAQKVWLLKVCDTLEDSLMWETYYSYKYRILTYQFKGRVQGLPQDYIKRLFNMVESMEDNLFEDFKLDKDSPHYIPLVQERNINFTLFGSKRRNTESTDNDYVGFKHELSVSTVDTEYVDIISKYGNASHKKNGAGTWYYSYRSVLGDQDKLLDIVDNIVHDSNVQINVKMYARMIDSDIKFEYLPLGNIREGMSVCSLINNEIVEDRVVKVEYENYVGKVYDLNVKDYRNYVANDIVVHNCIYGFRGSSYTIMERFAREWENATVISLPINYRSTQGIIDLGNLYAKKSFKGDGDLSVDSIAHNTNESVIDIDSCGSIVNTIKTLVEKGAEYKDIFVIYRTNAQGVDFEYELRANDIPCYNSEGIGITERPAVKTMLGYIKLAYDATDAQAFKDVFNKPNRFLSNALLNKILTDSNPRKLECVNVCTKSFEVTNFMKLVNMVEKFREAIESGKSVLDLVNMIDNTAGITRMVSKDNDEIEDKGKELNFVRAIAKKSRSVKHFLFMIEKISKDNLEKQKSGNQVVLMTVHRSKGLENKHVIVAGVDCEIFPHKRATDDEERRLFYVAITRAIEGLYVYGNSPYVDMLKMITITEDVKMREFKSNHYEDECDFDIEEEVEEVNEVDNTLLRKKLLEGWEVDCSNKNSQKVISVQDLNDDNSDWGDDW